MQHLIFGVYLALGPEGSFMTSPDSNHFHDLPAFTADFAANLDAGHELSLLLLEFVPSGAGVTFPVQYIHRELVYRTAGQKDAVALGVAKLADDADYLDVRILFSRPNATATLRGLVLEGQVKLVGSGPNMSSKRTREKPRAA